MSKSLGNVIEPQTIIKQSGAEVLRLWVAMVDYWEEIRAGKETLARVVEAYRKIRNTLRILVANLYDFDPATDLVPIDELQEIDRFVLARYATAAATTVRSYERYEFQTISHTITRLLTVDLSAFYIDVSKDALYTRGAGSDSRRSVQTVMYIMADGLTRLLAPLLPVTTDELWQHLPGSRADSVHLADFPTDTETYLDDALDQRWTRLLAIRDAVNVELEKLRQKKTVGTSLEARVVLRTNGTTAQLLSRCADMLPTLFIVSGVEVIEDPTVAIDGEDPGSARWSEPGGAVLIAATAAQGDKCPRCWRYVRAQSADPNDVCGRCAEALSETVSAG